MLHNAASPCPNCATIAQISPGFDTVPVSVEIGTIGALRIQTECTTCQNIVECLKVDWVQRTVGREWLPESVGDEDIVNLKWNHDGVAISVREQYVS
jgi:hypothetical protein